MERDFAQEGLPLPSEAMARQRYLGKELRLLTWNSEKLLPFHISTSRGKIVDEPTSDSVNAFAEWFFAGSRGSQGLRQMLKTGAKCTI
jgi:hypothetical protein